MTRDWLPCDHPRCRKPVAEVRDGKLLVLQRHDRDWHMTTLTIRDIERLLERMRESEQRAA